MKKVGDSLEFSATDLVGYLNCRHLAVLDRAVAEAALPKPKVWDPLLQILSERGAAHEQNYIEHLTKAGLEVVRIDCVDHLAHARATSPNLRQRTKTSRRARCLLKIAPQQAEAEPDHLITSNRFGVIARASFWPSSLTITGP